MPHRLPSWGRGPSYCHDSCLIYDLLKLAPGEPKSINEFARSRGIDIVKAQPVAAYSKGKIIVVPETPYPCLTDFTIAHELVHAIMPDVLMSKVEIDFLAFRLLYCPYNKKCIFKIK